MASGVKEGRQDPSRPDHQYHATASLAAKDDETPGVQFRQLGDEGSGPRRDGKATALVAGLGRRDRAAGARFDRCHRLGQTGQDQAREGARQFVVGRTAKGMIVLLGGNQAKVGALGFRGASS
jgi:hypothetical protein